MEDDGGGTAGDEIVDPGVENLLRGETRVRIWGRGRVWREACASPVRRAEIRRFNTGSTCCSWRRFDAADAVEVRWDGGVPPCLSRSWVPRGHERARAL